MADGESYKSWAWWLDALQAMRREYSIPMDAKEARVRSDVDFDNARRKVCRAMAEEARRKDQLLEEEERWKKGTEERSDLVAGQKKEVATELAGWGRRFLADRRGLEDLPACPPDDGGAAQPADDASHLRGG